MTLSRWKLFASALVLGTGGFAVFAMPPSEKSKPLPAPTTTLTPLAELPPLLTIPKNDGAETKSSPNAQPSTNNDLNFVVPNLPAKAPTETTETGPAPIKPVKFEPVPEPMKGSEDPIPLPPLSGFKEDKTPIVPNKVDPSTPMLPPLESPTPLKPVDNKEPIKLPDPKVPTLPDTPPPPLKGIDPTLPSFPDTPTDPKPVVPVEESPKTKGPTDKPKTPPFPPIEPTKPLPTPPRPEPMEENVPKLGVGNVDSFQPKTGSSEVKPAEATTKNDTSKLKMLVRLDSGLPRFEIRNSSIDEVLLKVIGNKIEMQNPEGKSPLVGVSSSGNVKFSGPGIEGTCDQLTIISATGEVLMKGNVKLRSKHGRNWSEITSDKMVYQIGATGLVPSKTTGTLTGLEKQR